MRTETAGSSGMRRRYEAECPSRKPCMRLIGTLTATAELAQQAKQLRRTKRKLSRTREQLAAASRELGAATAALRERDGAIQGLLRAAEDSAAAERAAQQQQRQSQHEAASARASLLAACREACATAQRARELERRVRELEAPAVAPSGSPQHQPRPPSEAAASPESACSSRESSTAACHQASETHPERVRGQGPLALLQEWDGRLGGDAAHSAERKGVQWTMDEPQQQRCAPRCDSCCRERRVSEALRGELAAARRDAAAASDELRRRALLDKEREEASACARSQGAIAAQRAARAEMRLLPHSEISERCRVEIAEGEALRRLADSMRTPRVAAAAEPQGAAGSRVIQQSRSGVGDTAAVAVHADAGWFLTLNIIALSVAPFAPRRWAPVCRDTAEAVCNVHKFWHNASLDVTINMASALGLCGDRTTNEWREPLMDWTMLINRIRQARPRDEEAKWRLELRARTVHNILEQSQLNYNDTLKSMRCTMERIRATRRVIREVLGM